MSVRDWPILSELGTDFLDTIRMAFVFGKTGNDAILIANDDKVYGVGTNRSGCLGVGDVEAHPLPTEVTNLNIEGIACGGEEREFLESSTGGVFVVAYSRIGEIYQWGFIPGVNGCWTVPERLNVNLNTKVTALACSYSHCMILCDDGKVFTWGSDEYGQLGRSRKKTLPDGDQNYYRRWYDPCQVMGILDGKRVIDISCGAYFSVALLEEGKVVTWGSNWSGELGINSAVDYSTTPNEVSALNKSKMKKIVCGSAHVLALSEQNMLYGWGSNSSSQLGFRSFCSPAKYKTPVNLTKSSSNLRIIDIGASYACDLSVVQCENKEVLMFGKLASGEISSKPIKSQCKSVDQVFAFHASPKMMLKPIRVTSEAEQPTIDERRTAVLDTLEKQFGNPEISDLTIIVDTKEIHVHQAILKMRSEYFKTMLDRWLKKDEKVVTIKDKSFDAINTYLKYLYTDKLEVDLNSAVDLLLLADEYGDDAFKSLCEKTIKRDMKADVVANVFVLTRMLKTCEDLNKFCLDFILNHATEVFNSPGFTEWDADTTKAVFMKYAEKKENC